MLYTYTFFVYYMHLTSPTLSVLFEGISAKCADIYKRCQKKFV